MRAADFTESMIKIGAPSPKALAWINRVYELYPGTFQNNHVMVWGEGEDQQFAMIELVPSVSKRDAVEVKWFQAYPLRQGVGSRAMQELQRLAREDDISLTLYPWDRGQVSQAKLMKFYRGHGFKPTARGSKNMAWEPELEEMAGEIHGNIRKVLRDKGYKYLGSGIDKQAWLEPVTGQVLLIFGYRKGVKGFSPDQHMFIDWVNYCNENKDNPHLPKFSGFESFEFYGETYLQCRMEHLKEVPTQVKYLVGHLEDVVDHVAEGDPELALAKLQSKGYWNAERGDLEYFKLNKIIKYLGGQEAAINLLNTVHQVAVFGTIHGFSVDLHSGNYMQRADGTIVVNDPFVLWLKSE